MEKSLLIGIGVVFLLGACGYIDQAVAPMNFAYNSSQQSGSSVSNGQQIYFNAVGQSGQRISYTGGPGFGGMMMGGYYTCASCHGDDGYGGEHYMHMQVMDAPAINYNALIEMKQEDSGGNPTEYSLDDFRGAVVEGHNTAGEQLKQDMPRWQMNDQDLANLLAFLKTLP
jgi:cytochrome c oxidase subunit 2